MYAQREREVIHSLIYPIIHTSIRPFFYSFIDLSNHPFISSSVYPCMCVSFVCIFVWMNCYMIVLLKEEYWVERNIAVEALSIVLLKVLPITGIYVCMYTYLKSYIIPFIHSSMLPFIHASIHPCFHSSIHVSKHHKLLKLSKQNNRSDKIIVTITPCQLIALLLNTIITTTIIFERGEII